MIDQQRHWCFLTPFGFKSGSGNRSDLNAAFNQFLVDWTYDQDAIPEVKGDQIPENTFCIFNFLSHGHTDNIPKGYIGHQLRVVNLGSNPNPNRMRGRICVGWISDTGFNDEVEDLMRPAMTPVSVSIEKVLAS